MRLQTYYIHVYTTKENSAFGARRLASSEIIQFCYTSQLKYVFWLEENVSRVIGQNFMTP